jgi:transcriptional regulator with XRE-family HTH domain
VDVAERFAENLTRQRKATPWSQEQLAQRADVHRTRISKFENAQELPRLDTLVKLAGALEVDLPKLIEGISWTPPLVKDGGFDVSDPKD